ncbi:A24 family peptidase [Telluria beijingensis]|uniref:A24 family peptidase n=1 Tax=Telluria beijingensis TaxID=3068633 RepID=UPI002795C04A|nr:prepilin peptidase [Massilia sp. REN29]
MTSLPLLLLFALLGAAVWHDVRARRIPNAIVFPGMLAAFALHALLPAGQGLFGAEPGGLGLLQSLCGWGLGLALLLPMYALRLMGAGDVKLLAMVGAFVGAGQILTVGMFTLVAGGVLALAFAAWQGSLRRLVANAYHMAMHTTFSALAGSIAAPVTPPEAASGRLPYAVAIAVASVGCVLWIRVHGELPL